MGSKPSSQSNTSQTYSPPAAVLQAYGQVVNQAQQVAATPYQAYSGQLVAPVNQQQNTGIGAVNSTAGIQDPYNTGATGLAAASSGAINPSTINSAAIQQYESPYNQDVVNATLATINNQNQQQSTALQGNAISSGAFGGDRAGIAQAALAGQQDLATNQTIANLNNQNYQQALSEANTQQATGLSAAQNTAARQLAASQQIGTLGSTAQTEALNEANAQVNAGTLQQTTQQAQDTANYNQYLQQLAYPFQTTGWLANIVEGIGSQSGGTTTGQTQTQTNAVTPYLGAALGAAALLARGGRVPHMAAGGGLGGGVTPYGASGVFDPTAPAQSGGLGGGSWVPSPSSMQAGHSGAHPAAAASQMTPGQNPVLQNMNQVTQMANAVKGAGNGILNTSLGDTIQDAVQDAGFASGGLVPPGGLMPRMMPGLAGARFAGGGTVLGDGGLMQRPHFDDGSDVDAAVAAAADANKVPLPIARALFQQESSMNPNAPNGGLGQVLASTARDPGYGMQGVDPETLKDPAQNAMFSLGYLTHKSPNTDWSNSQQVAAALQKYNGGGDPDYVQHVLSRIPQGQGLPASALAYDGDNSTGVVAPAVAAINDATGSTNTPAVASSPIDAAIGANPGGHSGLAGLNLSDSSRLGLLAAGLGIMGGTSRNAAVNIGQGGLQGLKTMMEGSQTQARTGLERAQTQSVTSDNQIKQQKLKMMMDQLTQNAKFFAGQAKNQASAPSSGNITAPTINNPTVSPQTQPTKQIDPRWDPNNLSVIAAQPNIDGTNPGADIAKARLQQIATTGRVQFTDGTWGTAPGFNEAEASTAAAKKQAETPNVDLATGTEYFGDNPPNAPAGIKAPVGSPDRAEMKVDPETAEVRSAIPPAPPGGGFPVPNIPGNAKVVKLGNSAQEQAKLDSEFQKDFLEKAPTVESGIERYKAIGQALKTFESGSLGQKQESGATMALALGQPGIAKMIMSGNPAGMQWVEKEGVGLTLDTLKAATPRFAQQEFKTTADKGVPTITNQPAANHQLISEGLAQMQRAKSFMEDWQTAKQQGWTSPSAFYTEWNKANPLNTYIKSAQKQIGNLAGMDLPSSNEWTKGSVYVVPKNLSPEQRAAFEKRGVKSGQMFRFNGRSSANPLEPIAPNQNFSAQLGSP